MGLLDNESRAGLAKVAGQVGTNERKIQKRLPYVALGALVAAPLLGPIGIAYAGAVVVGMGGRRFLRKKTRDAYNAQRTLDRDDEREELYNQMMVEKDMILPNIGLNNKSKNLDITLSKDSYVFENHNNEVSVKDE